MKRPSPELVVNLLLVAALLLGGAWLMTRTEWVEVWKPLPPKGEAARDPFYALKQVLIRLGARVQSPDNLDRLPPPGATLVLTSNQWDFVPGREKALRDWVEHQGGHLVLANFFGTGDDLAWVPLRETRRSKKAHGEDDEDDEPRDDSPSRAASAPDARPASAPSAKPVRPVPRRDLVGPRYLPRVQCDPLRELAGSAGAAAEPTGRRWRLCSADYARGLETMMRSPVLWAIDAPQGAVALRVPIGQGRATAATPWDLLFNDGLFKGDHAQAAVALLDVQAGREIWFVAHERREALALWLWHRAGPALVLLALALAFALWRGVLRFGPLLPQAPLARRSVAEQIRGTAAFVLRGGGAPLLAAARRALDDAARRRIVGYDRLDLGTRAQALSRATALPDTDLARALDARLRTPRGRALADLLALIETARRRLAPVNDPTRPRTERTA